MSFQDQQSAEAAQTGGIRSPTRARIKMKGRVHGTNVCELANCFTYVQVNIYNTDIVTLKEHGFDIEDWLRDTGYRSIIMDVPILNPLYESASEIVAKRSYDAEKMLPTGKMVVHTPDLHDGLFTPKSSSKPSSAPRHAPAEGTGMISEDEMLYEDCKVMSGEDPHIDTAMTASSIGETALVGHAKDHHSNSTILHSFPTLEGSAVSRNNVVDEGREQLASATAGYRADDRMSEDSSYIITELSPIAPLKVKSSDTIEEKNIASNKAVLSPSESRSRVNAGSSTVHDTGNEAEMSPKVNTPARKGRWKNHQLSPFVRTFECHYPIYQHHQRKHPDEEFAGAIDLETEEDMRELMELWRQCYSGTQPSHRHFYCKASTFDT